jgi:hypothetical protein
LLDGEPFPEDRCPFYSKDGREVRLGTEIYVSFSGSLMVDAWYSLRLSSVDSTLTAGPVFACPHVDLIPLDHKTDNFTRCKKYITHIWREPESVDDSDLVAFRVNQALEWGYKRADISGIPGVMIMKIGLGKSQRNWYGLTCFHL